MGMDQYLYAERQDPPEDLADLLAFDLFDYADGTVTVDGQPRVAVAYWRRAYTINRWFERKYQTQNNEATLIARFDLQKLLTSSKRAFLPYAARETADPDDTITDARYFDLLATIPQLEKVLALPDLYQFYYKAIY